MAKAKKHPPRHTPDPLVKEAEAMPKDKRARKYSSHLKAGSLHKGHYYMKAVKEDEERKTLHRGTSFNSTSTV